MTAPRLPGPVVLRAAIWFFVLAALGGCRRAAESAEPPSGGTPPGKGDFVGAEGCAPCHAAETAAWRRSPHGRHATFLARPDEGADLAVGSSWMQAYLKRDAEGWHRIVPRCYDLREKRWRDVEETLEEISGRFTDEGKPPRGGGELQARAFETDCSGCHASGADPRFDARTGRMEGGWRTAAIDCEACHGPGGEHARAWARLDAGKPLARIERLSARAATASCARCHSGPPTVGDWRVEEGDAFVTALDDRVGTFADGSASGQIYQYFTFVRSPCFRQGGLTCSGCHESHGPELKHQGATDVLCTHCHADHAGRSHTHHDPEGPGARCLECHMPKLLTGLMAHQRDHRIASPLPAAGEVPDACTACHKDRTKAWADAAWRDWWGEPPAATLAAIRAVAGVRRGDPGAKDALAAARDHPDPWFRAVAAWVRKDPASAIEDPVPEVRLAAVRAAVASRDPVPWLRQALRDTEPRVRAEALGALADLGEPVAPKDRRDLEVALRQVRDHGVPRLLLADAALREDRPADAVPLLEQVVAFHVGYAPAWKRLADAYALTGKVEEAVWARRRWARAVVEAVAAGRAEPSALAPAVSALLAGGDVDVVRGLLDEAAKRVREGPAADEVRRARERLERTYGPGSR